MKNNRSPFTIVMVFVVFGVVWMVLTSVVVHFAGIGRPVLVLLGPVNLAVFVMFAAWLMFTFIAKGQNKIGGSRQQQSRDNFEMLDGLETVPIILVAADKNGVITMFKGNKPHSIGCNLEEITGRPVDEVFKNCEDISDDFKRALDGESFENVRSWGNQVFQWYFRPSYDQQDNVRAVIGVAVDVTERIHRERELTKAKEAAEQAQRVRSEFIANLSHEIRTPLNIVTGYAGILRMKYGGETEEEDEEIYASIDEASDRLMNTVEKLVDVSRFNSGDFHTKLTEISLSQIINDVYEDFARVAVKKNLELTVHPPEPDIYVIADQHALRRAMAEVLENALKFTLKGKVDIRTEKVNDERAVVVVEDTGIGIAAEFMEHVFEEFSQEEGGPSRPFEGNGLGLALAKNFIELCNGDITLESEKGKGTKVMISLPVRQEAETISGSMEAQG